MYAVTVDQLTFVSVDFPSKSFKQIRNSQLQDENLKKNINGLEAVIQTEDYKN